MLKLGYPVGNDIKKTLASDNINSRLIQYEMKLSYKIVYISDMR